ncbi:bifunctional demethylmenaquinone methyltransferase/2-methoxy-6-polyprenyl-1,4-benzoquinol methylase UbiE [Rickettsiales bacterium]|nr:bifunctional demethylmenaquinone methyltransferase/2-methoxy-6-polyprenyl-1,4-benzoquinol methylase UbiE [Rickettsiales bacterium]
MNKETFFGFKKVNLSEKENLVKNVFNSVASKYDIMNDLMSFGIHRHWKDEMVKELHFRPTKKYKILDVAGGTGDVAIRIFNKLKKQNIEGDIEILDINAQMIKYCRDKMADKNLLNDFKFTVASGQDLPHKDNSVDFYSIAFGIRNFTDIKKGLEEAKRVLKPGGKFICLEFSKVNNKILKKFYELYSFNIIPKIGGLITKDQDSYQYLVESIEKFPKQEEFKKMIEDAGFCNVNYYDQSFGTCAIHVGNA